MRTLLAVVLLLGLAGYLTAADEKLTARFLIGKWTIKEVGTKTKEDPKVERSIEFKTNGTYAMDDRGTKTTGTFKLKGTTLELTDKASGAVFEWKDLSIKDGKLTRPLGRKGQATVELTRVVEEKKKDKK
jgi:uncharacterized protein (TIGR03066 family)